MAKRSAAMPRDAMPAPVGPGFGTPPTDRTSVSYGRPDPVASLTPARPRGSFGKLHFFAKFLLRSGPICEKLKF